MTRTASLKPLSPTVAGAGAALKRAGLTRSTSEATAVRGWRNTSTGFKVRAPIMGKAFALVEYVPKTWGADPAMPEQMLTRYAEVLTAAGFDAVRTAYDGTPKADGFYLSVFARVRCAQCGVNVLMSECHDCRFDGLRDAQV